MTRTTENRSVVGKLFDFGLPFWLCPLHILVFRWSSFWLFSAYLASKPIWPKLPRSFFNLVTPIQFPLYSQSLLSSHRKTLLTPAPTAESLLERSPTSAYAFLRSLLWPVAFSNLLTPPVCSARKMEKFHRKWNLTQTIFKKCHVFYRTPQLS